MSPILLIILIVPVGRFADVAVQRGWGYYPSGGWD